MILPLAAFLFGLLIGSFLNVCIHRLPKDESVVRPGSRCPYCGSPVRWFDNIPVLSFLLLRGRCRDCGAPISYVYPLVELLTGVLFAVIVARSGLGVLAAKHAVFVAMMIVLAFADLLDRILPDQITLGGTAAGLAFSLIQPLPGSVVHFVLAVFDLQLVPRWISLLESAVGAAAGAGVLWAVAEVYFRIRFREGMGLGDVKMMALIGAFLGIAPAFWVVMLASVLGALLGILFIVLFRKGLAYELPFGTFLAAAAVLVVIGRLE